VQQNGAHGFAPNEARRLFEPFYTTKPAGIGMGLAISRSIVTGRLWGVSNVNGGATFRFTLPLLAIPRSVRRPFFRGVRL